MRIITRVMAFAAVPILAASLSACSSGSEPKNIKGLIQSFEEAGYPCRAPYEDPDYPGTAEVRCGDDVAATWYGDAAKEVETYEIMDKIFTNAGIPHYTIRGTEWRIMGEEAAVKKVADVMGKNVTVGGKK